MIEVSVTVAKGAFVGRRMSGSDVDCRESISNTYLEWL